MLAVRLFGAGEARYGNRLLAGFPSQHPGMLLCYLLLHKPYPHNRERVASIFWENDSMPTARKHLCNTLWRLRQALQAAGADPDEYVYVHEETISFRTTGAYWLDVDELDQTVTAVLPIPEAQLAPVQAERMETALNLYVGDLLEGVFADWCLYERERLRLLYIQGLSKMMLYHGLNRRAERGLEYGSRILALDPTQEQVYRQMMWLNWLAGDRNAALAQYRRCTQVLREELGLRPADATRRLYEQILVDKVSVAEGKNSHELASLGPMAATVPSGTSEQSLAQRIQRVKEVVEATHEELHTIETLIESMLNEHGSEIRAEMQRDG